MGSTVAQTALRGSSWGLSEGSVYWHSYTDICSERLAIAPSLNSNDILACQVAIETVNCRTEITVLASISGVSKNYNQNP